ncbi:MAG: hypothetical protein WCT18_03450 [Patescibacteria group bacterium]
MNIEITALRAVLGRTTGELSKREEKVKEYEVLLAVARESADTLRVFKLHESRDLVAALGSQPHLEYGVDLRIDDSVSPIFPRKKVKSEELQNWENVQNVLKTAEVVSKQYFGITRDKDAPFVRFLAELEVGTLELWFEKQGEEHILIYDNRE